MKILFQGDSHIAYFAYAAKYNLLPPQHRYITQTVHGATAQGLTNPNSKTHALRDFHCEIVAKKPDCILTQLGEVDCGFLIWYWSERNKHGIDEQIFLSIDNYIDYLKKANKLIKHIIVTSPTLPTIKDGSYDDKYNTVANLRKEIKATQLERTELTLKYDSILKQRCHEEGFIHIECTHELLNEHGYIHDKYLHTNPQNHHLNNSVIAPIWANKLSAILDTINKN